MKYFPHIPGTIARMIEIKSAVKFPSIAVAFSFCSSLHWDWFCAFYLQQKMKMKKWLWLNPSLILQVTFDLLMFAHIYIFCMLYLV